MLLRYNDNEIREEEKLKKIADELEAIYLMMESGTQEINKEELENIQSLVKNLINQVKPVSNISIKTKIISTAKAILWEIEQQKKQQKKQQKNTVKSLLDFVKTSPGWVGDDFEECLEYVNQVRRE